MTPKSQLLPPWAVVHIPHDAKEIPPEVREQFLLDEAQLAHELLRMTDHHTLALFAESLPARQVLRSPVSRLVVDVERFEQDEHEPMAARGMGAIYQVTHALEPLRRPLTLQERESLLSRWYRPHHLALTRAVDDVLSDFGRALVIDAHSFPAQPLPYETDPQASRPEICIGADEFHTPAAMVEKLVTEFSELGYSTAVNSPFSGALVPLKHYRQDRRVRAVMIEVRRDLYLDESTGQPGPHFKKVAESLRLVLSRVGAHKAAYEDEET